MWLWSVPAADSGGSPSQSSSIRRSAGTTRLALRISSVSRLRRLAPLTGASAPPSRPATGPSTENSTIPLLRRAHGTALERDAADVQATLQWQQAGVPDP